MSRNCYKIKKNDLLALVVGKSIGKRERKIYYWSGCAPKSLVLPSVAGGAAKLLAEGFECRFGILLDYL